MTDFSIKENYPLSKLTWFNVGGPADYLFKPKTIEELITFLKNPPVSLDNIYILGAGSNVLIRDGGYKGVILKLGRGFNTIEFDGDHVICGAASLDRNVALMCRDQGLSGLEFLVGIPGSIGGAIIMNAGAYGYEVKDTLQWIEMVDYDGAIHRFDATDLTMTYRRCQLPIQGIVIKAAFKCHQKDPDEIQKKLTSYLEKREADQPVRGKTGGSTFKNPLPHRAWELIDQAGCRGLTINDAQMSEKHCNFMLNLNAATACDLESLGEKVRKQTKEKSGIDLEWEIKRIGEVA